MNLSGINIDAGTILSGAGTLFKSIREAITGEAILDPNKRAELLAQAQKMEADLEVARISRVLAESQSQDKWTSRGRPLFLYVIYIMLLSSIPMGVVYAISPTAANNVVAGFGLWLKAIPDTLYTLFGAGYLGYGAFRTYDKTQVGR